MELIQLDVSRVVYLTQVRRSAGQVYLPEAAAKLVERYSFTKFPAVDELQKDTYVFGIGRFRDVQISELGIYNDGVIASSRSNTQVLDNFIADLFAWLENEFGMFQIKQIKPEKYFESTMVVQSNVDLATVVAPSTAVADLITTTIEQEIGTPFYPSGTHFDCDATELKVRRKPLRFTIERRLGLPFPGNFFFCQAPLRTDDHLDLLRSLESMAQD